MDEESFGAVFKKLRVKKGISSRSLSTKIGKYAAYVSQLERQIIKAPDYESGKLLLAELGYESDEADRILNFFDVYSKEEEEAISYVYQQEAEKTLAWLDQKALDLKRMNDRLGLRLSTLIEKDQTKADNILSNLILLTSDDDGLNLLNQFFQYPFSQIECEDLKQAFQAGNVFIQSKYWFDEYGDFVRKGKSDKNR